MRCCVHVFILCIYIFYIYCCVYVRDENLDKKLIPKNNDMTESHYSSIYDRNNYQARQNDITHSTTSQTLNCLRGHSDGSYGAMPREIALPRGYIGDFSASNHEQIERQTPPYPPPHTHLFSPSKQVLRPLPRRRLRLGLCANQHRLRTPCHAGVSVAFVTRVGGKTCAGLHGLGVYPGGVVEARTGDLPSLVLSE